MVLLYVTIQRKKFKEFLWNCVPTWGLECRYRSARDIYRYPQSGPSCSQWFLDHRQTFPVYFLLIYFILWLLDCFQIKQIDFGEYLPTILRMYLFGSALKNFFCLFQALNGFLMMMTQNGKLLYISDNAAEYLGHSMVSYLFTNHTYTHRYLPVDL